MSAVEIDVELLAPLDAFIAERSDDLGIVTHTDAVNIVVRDWLMAQGFIPLSGGDAVVDALRAAKVPSKPSGG